ncbi:MAG TPA: ferritin-like domain-containing protein [Puia sp.]|nr:ferritin-like domain-containing protein [Puia sp.]
MSKATTTGRGKRTGKASASHRNGSRQTSARENGGPRANSSRSGSSGTSTDRESAGRTSAKRESLNRESANRESSNRESSSRDSGNRGPAYAGREEQANAGMTAKPFKGETHLEKFFLAQLKDIYYAEKKITQSLPKMREAATTEGLKDAFDDHLHQTERHIRRLEKAFESIGQRPEGEKCEAIEGIAREADQIIKETEEGTLTRDAALIIAAQKVEHYEIATYGGLVQLAITMQLHEAADLLDKTLVEEEDTDARLTEIAENDINLRAEHEDAQDWPAGETDEIGSEKE